MEIREIKQKLKIETVLAHYNLTPDRNNRLKCPFHKDKNPSLQVYPETGTWTCFSSRCNAGSGDQIDFIMKYENITKHQAIMKSKKLLGVTGSTSQALESLSRIAVLTKIFNSFQNGMLRSQAGRQYAKDRGLDVDKQEIGFNSGQYHHNGKVSDHLLKSIIKYSLLKPIGKGVHQVFGKNCICFALRNPSGQVTGLYFRSIFDTNGNPDQAKHFYLKDRQGLYPGYPLPETKKLILTEAIIDAATLLQIEELTREHEILALYGTNGLTEEHKQAIKDLDQLQEIILFFDGDLAGKAAIKKHSETLHKLKPGVKISYIETPQGEDVNSLSIGHDKENLPAGSQVFTHLIENRSFLFSIEKPSVELSEAISRPQGVTEKQIKSAKPSSTRDLDTSNPYNLRYRGMEARYSIRGGLRNDMDSLRVSLVIESIKPTAHYQKYPQ